jgi:hypothetical protein
VSISIGVMEAACFDLLAIGHLRLIFSDAGRQELMSPPRREM